MTPSETEELLEPAEALRLIRLVVEMAEGTTTTEGRRAHLRMIRVLVDDTTPERIKHRRPRPMTRGEG